MTTEHDYECGCRSRDGIVIARCAEATAMRANLDMMERKLEAKWGRMTGLVGWEPEARLLADEIDRDKRACGAQAAVLSAHYPSRFAAPQPCGPVEVTL